MPRNRDTAGPPPPSSPWAGRNLDRRRPHISFVLIAFYLLAAGVAYLWAGRDSDVGAVMRVGGDERQRRLDRDAAALSGLAMGLTAIAGAIVSAARNHGDIGGYGLVCFVGGVAYALSLFLFKRRS